MWAGLGYYRRARYLLEGAKYIMDELDGVFPDSSAELQKIPGCHCLAVLIVISSIPTAKFSSVLKNGLRMWSYFLECPLCKRYGILPGYYQMIRKAE